MRKKLAFIFAVIMIIHSVFNVYKMVAHAAMPPAVVGPAIYDSFSVILGNYLGYGKSLDSFNNDFTSTNMSTFANNQLAGNSVSWNGTDVSELTNKNKFISFLNSSLAKMVSYNSGEANALYDALNQRSYSATGTVSTKTLEDEIRMGLDYVSAMSETEFKTNMTNTFKVLDTSNTDVNAYDIAVTYGLFKLLSLGLISNASTAGNAEWSQTVENSSFTYSDLYTFGFEYNGQIVRMYNLSSFNLVGYGSWSYDVRFSDCVYIVPYYDNSSFRFYVVNEDAFNYEQIRYNNGKYYDNLTKSSLTSNNIYYVDYGLGCSEENVPFLKPLPEFTTSTAISEFKQAVNSEFKAEYISKNSYLEDVGPISTKHPTLKKALEDFMLKDITINDIVDLATNIAGLADTSVGTETSIDDLVSVINGLTVTLPDIIVDGKNDVVKAVEGVGEAILTLPKAIWLQFEGTLEAIKTKALTTTRPWEDGENKENSNDILPIFNGLIILIMIVVALLKIFIHCLQFIINIFAIPASSDLLPEEMRLGLEYINTIEIPIIGMSVYSFMMGLVYILIVFYAIRILRINVDRIKIPKQKTGGM